MEVDLDPDMLKEILFDQTSIPREDHGQGIKFVDEWLRHLGEGFAFLLLLAHMKTSGEKEIMLGEGSNFDRSLEGIECPLCPNTCLDLRYRDRLKAIAWTFWSERFWAPRDAKSGLGWFREGGLQRSYQQLHDVFNDIQGGLKYSENKGPAMRTSILVLIILNFYEEFYPILTTAVLGREKCMYVLCEPCRMDALGFFVQAKKVSKYIRHHNKLSEPGFDVHTLFDNMTKKKGASDVMIVPESFVKEDHKKKYTDEDMVKFPWGPAARQFITISQRWSEIMRGEDLTFRTPALMDAYMDYFRFDPYFLHIVAKCFVPSMTALGLGLSGPCSTVSKPAHNPPRAVPEGAGKNWKKNQRKREKQAALEAANKNAENKSIDLEGSQATSPVSETGSHTEAGSSASDMSAEDGEQIVDAHPAIPGLPAGMNSAQFVKDMELCAIQIAEEAKARGDDPSVILSGFKVGELTSTPTAAQLHSFTQAMSRAWVKGYNSQKLLDIRKTFAAVGIDGDPSKGCNGCRDCTKHNPKTIEGLIHLRHQHYLKFHRPLTIFMPSGWQPCETEIENEVISYERLLLASKAINESEADRKRCCDKCAAGEYPQLDFDRYVTLLVGAAAKSAGVDHLVCENSGKKNAVPWDLYPAPDAAAPTEATAHQVPSAGSSTVNQGVNPLAEIGNSRKPVHPLRKAAGEYLRDAKDVSQATQDLESLTILDGDQRAAEVIPRPPPATVSAPVAPSALPPGSEHVLAPVPGGNRKARRAKARKEGRL